MPELVDASPARPALRRTPVSLTRMSREIAAELAARDVPRAVRWDIAEALVTHGDPGLVRVLLTCLIGTTFARARLRPRPCVEVGRDHDGTFYVRDADAIFDPPRARVWGLHVAGLAACERIVERHGGELRADSGGLFRFRLEPPPGTRHPTVH